MMWAKGLFLRGCVCLLSICWLPSALAMPAKRALLVGIDRYENVRPLNGPVADTRNMRDLLVRQLGYQDSDIQVLTNQQAHHDGILQALQDWLVAGSQPGDELLFYFSGHGYQIKDRNGDESDGMDEILVPYDLGVKNGKIVNGLVDDDMHRLLDRLADRKLTVIIDSCHSGTLTRSFNAPSAFKSASKTLFSLPKARLSRSMLRREEKSFLPSRDNLEVWTAVAASQKALVDIESQHGSFFTNRFISGIGERKADINRDGAVTRSELIEFLRSESSAFCQRNPDFCPFGLTPTVEVSGDQFSKPFEVLAAQVAVANSGQVGAHSPDMVADQFPRINSETGAAGSLKLDIFPQRVPIGGALALTVSAPVSGHLLLLDVRASGQVIQLFPNRYSRRAQRKVSIDAGERWLLPGPRDEFEWFADAPAGRGEIVAIISEDDAFSGITSKYKDLQIIEAPEDYLSEVSQALNQVWTGGAHNREAHWVIARQTYEVVH